MKSNNQHKNLENIPKPVHLWEIDGFVKLSNNCRNKSKILIKNYGVRRLSKELGLDRETIYSTQADIRDTITTNFTMTSDVSNYKSIDIQFALGSASTGDYYDLNFPINDSGEVKARYVKLPLSLTTELVMYVSANGTTLTLGYVRIRTTTLGSPANISDVTNSDYDLFKVIGNKI